MQILLCTASYSFLMNINEFTLTAQEDIIPVRHQKNCATGLVICPHSWKEESSGSSRGDLDLLATLVLVNSDSAHPPTLMYLAWSSHLHALKLLQPSKPVGPIQMPVGNAACSFPSWELLAGWGCSCAMCCSSSIRAQIRVSQCLCLCLDSVQFSCTGTALMSYFTSQLSARSSFPYISSVL